MKEFVEALLLMHKKNLITDKVARELYFKAVDFWFSHHHEEVEHMLEELTEEEKKN